MTATWGSARSALSKFLAFREREIHLAGGSIAFLNICSNKLWNFLKSDEKESEALHLTLKICRPPTTLSSAPRNVPGHLSTKWIGENEQRPSALQYQFWKLEKAVAVGLLGGSRGKLRESRRKIAGKFSRSAKCMLQILGFRAPGKANLPGILAGTLSPPSVRGVFWNRQFQPSRVFLISSSCCVANPPASCRCLSRPPGPKSPKSLKKSLPGAPAAGSPKVWKKSRKSPKSLAKVSKMSVRDFFETFSRLFWDRPFFRLFSDFLGISGPEGPRDSCSSSEGSQLLCSLNVYQVCLLSPVAFERHLLGRILKST